MDTDSGRRQVGKTLQPTRQAFSGLRQLLVALNGTMALGLFAHDSDRLARFERKAQVLASLNHPHIAAIYGVEETPAAPHTPPRRALVMELVDGATLADRMAQGPIPIDEALGMTRQIAAALEAAHERGIIHRDLKPANIKVREDGAVKVLDFGLAKHAQLTGVEPSVAHELDNSPTLTVRGRTDIGVILGTAAYMAPEQAKGKPMDKRADIWAFGWLRATTSPRGLPEGRFRSTKRSRSRRRWPMRSKPHTNRASSTAT
ncbi:MAG: serine/threonine-protein kinase [Acidobacteriota bacterium]